MSHGLLRMAGGRSFHMMAEAISPVNAMNANRRWYFYGFEVLAKAVQRSGEAIGIQRCQPIPLSMSSRPTSCVTAARGVRERMPRTSWGMVEIVAGQPLCCRRTTRQRYGSALSPRAVRLFGTAAKRRIVGRGLPREGHGATGVCRR